MKFVLALSLLVSASALRKELRRENTNNKRRLRTYNGGSKSGKGGKGKDVSFEPGNFDWGRLIKE